MSKQLAPGEHWYKCTCECNCGRRVRKEELNAGQQQRVQCFTCEVWWKFYRDMEMALNKLLSEHYAKKGNPNE